MNKYVQMMILIKYSATLKQNCHNSINKQTNTEGVPALCLLIILFLYNRFQNIPEILIQLFRFVF